MGLEIYPGIPPNGISKISLESVEGQNFCATLTAYHRVFYRDHAGDDTLKGLSQTAKEIYKREGQYSWNVVFADVMEKRLGKPINPATLNIPPVISAIRQMADQAGKAFPMKSSLNTANPRFNTASFINCCLDKIGVQDGESPRNLPPEAVRLSDFKGMHLAALDPKTNPGIVSEMKRHAAGEPHPVKFNEELAEIATSDHATRIFISEKRRLLALTVRYFERMIGGPLDNEELKFARTAYKSLFSLATDCKFSQKDADFSFYDFVNKSMAEIPKFELQYDHEPLEYDYLARLRLKSGLTGGTFLYGDKPVRFIIRGSSYRPQCYIVPVSQYDSSPNAEIGRNEYHLPAVLHPDEERLLSFSGGNPFSIRMTDTGELLVFNPNRYQPFEYNRNDFDEVRNLSPKASVIPLPTPDKRLQSRKRMPDNFDIARQSLGGDVSVSGYATRSRESSTIGEFNGVLLSGKVNQEGKLICLTEAHDEDKEKPVIPEIVASALADGVYKTAYDTALAQSHDPKDAHRKASSAFIQKVVGEIRKSAKILPAQKAPDPHGNMAYAAVDPEGNYLVGRIGQHHQVFLVSDERIAPVFSTADKPSGILGDDPQNIRVIISTGQLQSNEQILIVSDNLVRTLGPDTIRYYLRMARNDAKAVNDLKAVFRQLDPKSQVSIAIIRKKPQII